MTPRDLYLRLLTYRTRQDDLAPILTFGLIEEARFRWMESKERIDQPPTDKNISERLVLVDVDQVFERARRALSSSNKQKKHREGVFAFESDGKRLAAQPNKRIKTRRRK